MAASFSSMIASIPHEGICKELLYSEGHYTLAKGLAYIKEKYKRLVNASRLINSDDLVRYCTPNLAAQSYSLTKIAVLKVVLMN